MQNSCSCVKRALLSFVIAAFPLICSGAQDSVPAAKTQPEISGKVEPNSGNYQITSQNPPWTFSGNLGSPIRNFKTAAGSDPIGPYNELTFEWQADQIPLKGSIRTYKQKPLALFSQTCT